MKQKIKSLIISMGSHPKMFASNKESFALQIYTMLYLLKKISTHEEKIAFFKKAKLIKGYSLVNCNDSFDDIWAINIVKYALDLIS